MSERNRIKVDMVDMAEAMNDPNAEVMEKGEASIDAIPDLDVLTAKIVEILEYLELPEVKKVCEKDDSIIRMSLINKYADSVPLNFIDLFMDKDEEHKQESIERTLIWIEQMAKVKAGEADLEEVSKSLVDEVNQRYVYSKYGGKENFEKTLRKELAKEQRKGRGAKSRGF
jgi:hypothetical protein